MITENDLQEAILECQGKRNPNAETCIMLAAFYTIRDHLFPQIKNDTPQYSYDPEPVTDSKVITYYSDTDFGKAVEGKRVEDVISLMDEVMSTVQVLHPKLYGSIMERI